MVPSLDKNMDAKKGVIAMCEAIMPGPRLQGQKPHQVVRPTWVPGKTMLFGKDYTLDTFERWHKEHLALTLQRWTRINVTFTSRLRDFLDATARIQNHYRRILDRRRMAKVEAFIVRAQCMLRAAKFREEYAKRRDLHRSVRVCVRVVSPSHLISITCITLIQIDPTTTTNTGTHRATRTSTLLVVAKVGSHEL